MQRTIKSYVLRAGRISNRQQHALQYYLPAYELKKEAAPWDLSSVFGRDAETVIEVGFGMGTSLLEMAKARPEVNFIGIEVHLAGIGSLAAGIQEYGLANIRIAAFDAVELFKTCIADNALLGVQIFFPDPWPKKKHHKRRLIQGEFVKLLSRKIKSGGFIHCATDWQDYAEHMLAVLSEEPALQNQAGKGYSPRPATRPVTKFEQRGSRLGHGVWDLIFIRRNELDKA
ncbi:tRNA (guanosine(46)-N7)-methyltransferase TrmB [Legionella londiniensis]|uniref:tRNA (guanine-N(7)-)-methyltransferase n=1 Tax=Legionella londiniensis TaxID=45068 RepID=A0A0W0VST1_9GAMM|nr:tRNA (guanosine(46)-N7)-methyltransferase TrmB [Legionella londiniensis]KTD23182.1 tRNA (m7G46) methyltransferase, SAM-dependent [Legionella londiniensis]STX93807.1 tRNA (m7G46) methyltransferase, SAM-dependent [Legionella londiniensis]